VKALPVIVSALILALALASCASYDKAQVESTILDDVSKQVEGLTGSKIKSATCPDDVKPEKGTEFECEAKLSSGKKLTIPYVFANDNGDYRLDVSPEQLRGTIGSG
jgi:hypothetical protein